MDIETHLTNEFLRVSDRLKEGYVTYTVIPYKTDDFGMTLNFEWDCPNKLRKVTGCNILVNAGARLGIPDSLHYFHFKTKNDLPLALTRALEWIEERKKGCKHPSNQVVSYQRGRCFWRHVCSCGAFWDIDSGD